MVEIAARKGACANAGGAVGGNRAAGGPRTDIPGAGTSSANVPEADDIGAGDPANADEHRAQGAERTCIVTRDVLPAEALVRFVRGPDGAVVPDVAQKLPGRGVWVTASRQRVGEAVKRNAFKRAFRADVDVASDLDEQVDQLLLKRTLQALSLANKSGDVVAGQAKVSSALETGAVAVLVQAVDAAEGSRQRMAGKFRAISESIDRSAISIDLLTNAELSLALGRENVVHAALIDSRSTTLFANAAERLMRYRAVSSLAVAGTEAPNQRGGADAFPDQTAGADEKQD